MMGAPSAPGNAGLAEWLIAVVSTLAVLGAVAFLVVEGLTDQHPPAFEVEVLEVRKAGAGFVLEVRVRNTGDQTAAMVNVQAELGDRDGAVVETAAAEIDYVPGGSQRRAGLVFARNPNGHEVDVRVVGYTEP